MEKDVSSFSSSSLPRGRGRGKSRQSANSPLGATRKSKLPHDERQMDRARGDKEDGMKSHRVDHINSEHGEIDNAKNSSPVMSTEGKERLKGKRPSAQVYVPRARRLLHDQKETLQSPTEKPQERPQNDLNETGTRKNRPAVGVYVPRAKRLQMEALQSQEATSEPNHSLPTEMTASENDLIEQSDDKPERKRSEGSSEKKHRKRRTKSKEAVVVTNELSTVSAGENNDEEGNHIHDSLALGSKEMDVDCLENTSSQCKDKDAFENPPSPTHNQEQKHSIGTEEIGTECINANTVVKVDEKASPHHKNIDLQGDKECSLVKQPCEGDSISNVKAHDSHIETIDLGTVSQQNDVSVSGESKLQVLQEIKDDVSVDISEKQDCDIENRCTEQDQSKLSQEEKASFKEEKNVSNLSLDDKRKSKDAKEAKISKSATRKTKKSSKKDKITESSVGAQDMSDAKPVANIKMDEQKLLKMGMIVQPDDTEHEMISKKKKQQKRKMQEINKARSLETGETVDNCSDTADKKEDGDSMDVEESWDDMFDDDGEALDPTIMEELTAAVGQVSVQKTQFDYYNFQPKDPDMDFSEYNHLIEISEFPKEFLTRDLIIAFKEYQDRGFDIKWVDDTHAIGVFSSSIAAQAALQMKHPMIKVKSMAEATRATKLKAKKSTEFLQPYKERPETTAAIARNLVAGALGMTGRVSKEKRDEDRKRLKEAREKKKQASRDKKNAWEGVVGKCAMDNI